MSKFPSDGNDVANIIPYKENMDTISIRYGESVVLPLDAGDTTAEIASIFIGKPGETYILTKQTTLTDGQGVFELSATDTQIPLGVYSYQINITDALGQLEKYPSPDTNCGDCEDEFPKFIVSEALDLTEVS